MFEIIGCLVVYCIVSTCAMAYFSFNTSRYPLINKLVGMVFFPGWWLTSKTINWLLEIKNGR